jgi:SAM-dependent methyltransferase
MRVRDSGMPEETYWESLFDVPLILDRLEIDRYRDIVEFGCGYGTFSVPIARRIAGTLYTFDIDAEMVRRTQERSAGLRIQASVRDVMKLGFGVNADAALLFNILHCEEPLRLFSHAVNAAPDVIVIHWRSDIATPRGPAAEIRPQPDQVRNWGTEAGLRGGELIVLPPWHYGIVFARP